MEALLAGLVIGLGSGVAPGPLLALAIATTLQRGLRPGLAVACGPLVSDAFIIALSVTLVSRMPDPAVIALSVAGAVVIAYFGIETLRASRSADVTSLRNVDSSEDADSSESAGWLTRWTSHPLVQGTVINLLNPAPWIFWVTAGSTLLIGFWDRSPALAVGYLVTFYVGLVGSKILIVSGIAAGRHRLSSRAYRGILAGTGVALLALAIAVLARAATLVAA
jgi:threonine/homoserine/homoserine lactone efflux protein